jgi:hypothetical protein
MPFPQKIPMATMLCTFEGISQEECAKQEGAPMTEKVLANDACIAYYGHDVLSRGNLGVPNLATSMPTFLYGHQ